MDHITYDIELAHVLWSTIFSGTVERAAVRTGDSFLSLAPPPGSPPRLDAVLRRSHHAMSAQMQETQHRETPQGPGVQMTPERAQCPMLSYRLQEAPRSASAVMERWTK